MDALLLLLVVGAPLTAAIKGVGSRATWFGLSATALLLAVASSVASMRETQVALETIDEVTIQETYKELRRECEEDSERYQQSCDKIAQLTGFTSEEAAGHQSRAFVLFASGFLGFLLAGLFYRSSARQLGRPPGPALSPHSPTPARPPLRLRISPREVRGVLVLDLRGQVVLGEECNTLRDQVMQALAAKKKNLLLNLEEVGRMDSAGIGVLIAAVVETAKEGGKLKLVNVPKLIHNTLIVHRLLSAFEIYDDKAQAIASF